MLRTTGPRPQDILSRSERLVIKIGTETLIKDGAVNMPWLEALAEDIAFLKKEGKEVVVVTSGAIGLGRSILGIDPMIPTKNLSIEDQQQASIHGQPLLAMAYIQAFGKFGLKAPQILITKDVTEHPEQLQLLKNAALPHAATLPSLANSVPVINENDAIAIDEIKFGDNDKLSAIITGIIEADTLIHLSDVDGFYTDNPKKNENAQFIPHVTDLTGAFSCAHDDLNGMSRGGMKGRLEAIQIATDACARVILTLGKDTPHCIRNLYDGKQRGSVFSPDPAVVHIAGLFSHYRTPEKV
ncbi:MAG: glutamate 5-kinase [Pseudobdellovibrionaceae bacterium]